MLDEDKRNANLEEKISSLIQHCKNNKNAANSVHLFAPSLSMWTFCSTLSTGRPVIAIVKEMFIKALHVIS